MKYQTWKIKTEHNILNEFKKLLSRIEWIQEIKRIIPGRIYRKQKWSSHEIFSFSYYTETWIKYIAKKWATAQEIFILCDHKHKEKIYNLIENIKKSKKR